MEIPMDCVPSLLAYNSDIPLGIASAGQNSGISIYLLKINLVEKTPSLNKLQKSPIFNLYLR